MIAPSGRGATRGASERGADALVSSAYGELTSTRARTPKVSDFTPSEAFRVEIFPSGVMVRRNQKVPIEPPKGTVRGDIEGFSPEASRRLREFCVTQEAKGLVPWSMTGTVHRAVSPDEWRSIMSRFRHRVKGNGWACVWRVELQKRKVPHVHLALWLRPDEQRGAPMLAWLECTGELFDLDAVKHAFKGRRIESVGWAVYLALHSGKSKEAQLGWLGKQWGIWNREAFSRIEASALSRDLPVDQERALRRFLGRLMRSKGSRARIGRAGFLRCMDGRTVDRFLAGWDAGVIGPGERQL